MACTTQFAIGFQVYSMNAYPNKRPQLTMPAQYVSAQLGSVQLHNVNSVGVGAWPRPYKTACLEFETILVVERKYLPGTD